MLLTVGIALELLGAAIAVPSAFTENMVGFFVGFGIAGIGISLALRIVLNWSAMRYPYSLLGPYRPTPFPTGWNPHVISASWCAIGENGFNATVPLATWYVAAEGIGLDVLWVTKVFIRTTEITGIERCAIMGYRLHHSSPECPSPLIAPASVPQTLIKQAGECPFASQL